MSTRLPETAGKLTTSETTTTVTHCIENESSLPNSQNLVSGPFFNLKMFNRHVNLAELSTISFSLKENSTNKLFLYPYLSTRIFLNFTFLSAMIY
jgi:hypothetical protein